MVYNGPSTGCLTCRRRKVRCSKERPSCQNCVKRKQLCPGYDDVFDARHRNQTQSVIKRATPKSKSQDSDGSIVLQTPPPSPGDHTNIATFAMDSATLSTLASIPSVPLSQIAYLAKANPACLYSLPLNMEATAIDFFFNNYSRESPDAEARHGTMGSLVPMYKSASPTSPLNAATTSIAVNMLMLFTRQGSDTIHARNHYIKAITNLKHSIVRPNDGELDNMIMAILILDFYDTLNARFHPGRGQNDAHKSGALALIMHRGQQNFASESSKTMAAVVRATVAHWAVDNDKDISPEALALLSDPSLVRNKADQLDVLTLRAAVLNTRSRHLRDQARRWDIPIDSTSWELLRNDALRLDGSFEVWFDTVPADWRPEYVSAEDLEPSIRFAGMWGERCTVFKDLEVANLINAYAMRRICVLQVLKQSCLQCASAGDIETCRRTIETSQHLVNVICESLPFHVGDAMMAELPDYPFTINYPFSYRDGSMLPDPSIDHPRSAMAEGGWIMYTFLQEILRLVRPDNDTIPLELPEDQVTWMEEQMERIAIVYTFPTSKRPTPHRHVTPLTPESIDLNPSIMAESDGF